MVKFFGADASALLVKPEMYTLKNHWSSRHGLHYLLDIEALRQIKLHTKAS